MRELMCMMVVFPAFLFVCGILLFFSAQVFQF